MSEVELSERRIAESFARIREAQACVHQALDTFSQNIELEYQAHIHDLQDVFWAESEPEGAGNKANVPALPAANPVAWAIRDWDDPIWQHYAPPERATIPSVLRVGLIKDDENATPFELPALIEFVSHRHLLITAEDSSLGNALARDLTTRLVLISQPGTVRVELVDAANFGKELAGFLRLPESMRNSKVLTQPEEIESHLGTLQEHVETVIQHHLSNVHSTIEEYNAALPSTRVPYRILVVCGFPAGFSDRSAERLLELARSGPRAGIYLMLSRDSTTPGQLKEFDQQSLIDYATTVVVERDRISVPSDSSLGRFSIIPDRPPQSSDINRWFAAIESAESSRGTALRFADIAPPAHERWTADSTDGLAVPIGVGLDGVPHLFQLGGTGVVHHALLGGMVGSGKSNLLHVLITQLASRYPPEELELYLVDFREGVEFQDYVALPHARAVGLESEREFGLSILRRLRDEMENRGAMFVRDGLGAGDLPSYRRMSGQRLPRVVMIIDEFQVLFNEDDWVAQEAARVLEDLVRRGRGFGIHVLLSSQTPSVPFVYGSRIYNQMGLRIALRTRSDDAAAILGERNTAASELSDTGEAIYNDNMGDSDFNHRIRIALLQTEERRRILADIQSLASDGGYPPAITFQSRTSASLEHHPHVRMLLEGGRPRTSPEHLSLWLGESIELKPPTEAVIERDPGNNLLIAGGSEDDGYGLLTAATLSAMIQYQPNEVEFVVADFARSSSPNARVFPSLADLFEHRLTVRGQRDAADETAAILDILDHRAMDDGNAHPTLLVVVAGLNRWRALRTSRGEFGGPGPLTERLLRIADEGPDVGVHLMMWVDSLSSLSRLTSHGSTGYFDLRVALRVDDQESAALLGTRAAALMAENRAIFRHEDWGSGRAEKFKPYTVPGMEQIREINAALAASEMS